MLIPLAPSIEHIDVITTTNTGILITEFDIDGESEEVVLLSDECCCCERTVMDYLESETYLYEHFF